MVDFLQILGRRKQLVLSVYVTGRIVTLNAFLITGKSGISIEIVCFRQIDVSLREMSREIVASLIESFLEENKLSPAFVLWVVPQEYVILRRFILPKLGGKELESALMLNVRRYLPCKIGDIFYGKKYVLRNGGYDVLFYGVLRDYVTSVVPLNVLEKNNVIFVPEDAALVSLVKSVRYDLSDKIFSLAYKRGDNYGLVLVDAVGDVLFKIVSDEKNLQSEASLFLEYYKRMYKTVENDLSFPTLKLGSIDVEEWEPISYHEFIGSLMIENIVDDFGVLLSLGAAFFFKNFGILIKEHQDDFVSPVSSSNDLLADFSLDEIREKVLEFFEKIPDKIMWIILVILLGFGGARYYWAYEVYRSVKSDYDKVIKGLPHDVFSKPELVTDAEIVNKQMQLQSLVDVLQKYRDNRRNLRKVLEVISKDFTRNIWLRLPFDLSSNMDVGQMFLTINGGIYFGDEDEEVKALEELISKLRKDFKGYFSNIELLYFRRKVAENGKEYLMFSLQCK